jgi:hypothetical protein
MKLNVRGALVVCAALNLTHITSCASKSENDESLEASEPVEAEPASAAEAAVDGSGAAGGSGGAVASEPSSYSATPAPAAGQASGSMASGRRVMYVKVNGAALRDRPDPKAQVLSVLEKGDHMLVTVEGDWARTDDGKYVSMKVLSEKGVGRNKKDAAWSAGRPAAATSKRSKTSNEKSAPQASGQAADASASGAASGTAAESQSPESNDQ